jgi:hypothetical protein
MPVRLMGAALVSFGLAVALISSRRPVHPAAALAVTVADAGWVVASLVAVGLAGGVLGSAGSAAVLGVAAVVALLAGLQLRGLRRFARNAGGRTSARSRFLLARPVGAAPEVVWRRLKALDRIGEYSDTLARVEVEEVDGVARRTCSTDDGARWSEEVMEMDDARRALVLRFDTSEGRFPLPVEEMVGGWRVRAHGEATYLVLWYEYTLRGGPAGEVLAALADLLLRRQLGPVFERLGAPDPAGSPAEANPAEAGRPA